jgi:alkylation response protein AidB-like acyl-CoA dehydrogenase
MKKSVLRVELIERLRNVMDESLPLPGHGQTALRHRRLMEIGREDLSLARLAEAHTDAVAILAEAGREPEPGKLYGVWAAEIPGESLRLENHSEGYRLTGQKSFCSGAGLIDRALITLGGDDPRLVEVNLTQLAVTFDASAWSTEAFALTNTATALFAGARVAAAAVVGSPGFYLQRPGFWHGACGPAACWAGGAIGLIDWAITQLREDAHTLAHLGAMQASAWSLQAILQQAGEEIDAAPADAVQAHVRALTVRHLVEQAATDVLRRLPRAFGPHPLAFHCEVSRQYRELDLYLRQSHAERDLEALGRAVRSQAGRNAPLPA